MAKGQKGPGDARTEDDARGDRGRGRAVPSDPRSTPAGSTVEDPSSSTEGTPGEDEVGTRKRG